MFAFGLPPPLSRLAAIIITGGGVIRRRRRRRRPRYAFLSAQSTSSASVAAAAAAVLRKSQKNGSRFRSSSAVGVRACARRPPSPARARRRPMAQPVCCRCRLVRFLFCLNVGDFVDVGVVSDYDYQSGDGAAFGFTKRAAERCERKKKAGGCGQADMQTLSKVSRKKLQALLLSLSVPQPPAACFCKSWIPCKYSCLSR